MESITDTLTDTMTEVAATADPEIGEMVSAFSDLTFNEILRTVLTFLIGLVIIRIILRSLHRLADRFQGADKTVSGFLISAVRIILSFVLLTVCFSMMGIPVTSLVAVVSMFVLAVSLSLQNILANIVSGIVILISHPFRVGDWIETPGTAGTVGRIDLMYTHLRAADLREIMVPNSELVSGVITNYSNMRYRKIILNLRIGYEAETEAVTAALLRAMDRATKGTDTGDEVPFAGISAFRDNGIEYLLRFSVLTSAYWDVYYRLLPMIREELGRSGIVMDYAATRVIRSGENIKETGNS